MIHRNRRFQLAAGLFTMFGFASAGLAQTFNGSVINTGGNSLIPSTGTGGCAVAPQTSGGTLFDATVAGISAAQGAPSVLLNFTHTFGADIDMYLRAPNGQLLELSTDNGGAGDNFTNTVFVDGAAQSITAGTSPFTGNFRPEGTLTVNNCGLTITPTVSTLAGFTAGQNGTWQLVILDDAGSDVGAMLNWSLTFPPVSNADLAVVLSDSPDPVTAGNNLSYTAQLTNTGPSDATNASVALPVPAGTTFVSASADGGGTCTNVSPITCTWAGITANGAVRIATIVVAVPANAVNGSLINAAVTATSNTPDADPADNFSSAGSGVITVADLSMALTDMPDPVTAGSQLTYSAALTNAGPSDAQNARFSVNIPAGTSFVSATPVGGSCSGTTTVTCTWPGATVPTTSRSATIVVSVPAATADGSSLLASSTATSDTSDTASGNNNFDATTTVTAAADLAITLSDSPDPVFAGNQLTYVAILSNGGLSDAQGATITLPLPAGTSPFSASASVGGSCAIGGTVVCTWAGATAPGTMRTATIVVTVNSSQTANLSATATASSSTNDPAGGNNSATEVTVVQAQADLSITLTDAPDPVVAGTNLTYTATVSNAGPSDATAVVVNLPTPTGTSFVSGTVSGGGSCAAGISCSITGNMLPGTARTVSIVVTVNSSQTANLSATATASSSTNDPAGGNNSATEVTVVQAQADLSITLTDAPDPVVAGTNLTYTATVSNAGPSDATAVVVNLPTPTGTSFVSGTVSGGGSCAAGISCSITGNMLPGTARTVSITVLVGAAVLDGTVINATATVTASSPDPIGGNNSFSTSTTVIARADLLIGLTSSVPQVLINVPVSFTATSQNLGPSNAQNVSITLTLTPDFRYTSLVASGATCTTPQIGTTGAIVCTWAGATAPGVTRTLTVVAFSNNLGTTAVNASTTSPTTDPVPNNNATGLTVVVGFPFNGIPTLSQYGLMLLGLLIGLMGFVAVRRQS